MNLVFEDLEPGRKDPSLQHKQDLPSDQPRQVLPQGNEGGGGDFCGRVFFTKGYLHLTLIGDGSIRNNNRHY